MLSSLSCESSLSSTPVLGSASSGSFTSETSILQRNMSSLSLPSDDMAQSVLHQVPAGSWPPVAHDHLGALLAAGKAPLAGSLHGMVLPDAATLHAAVQAATLQHRLAMLQVRSLAGRVASWRVCTNTLCSGRLGTTLFDPALSASASLC
jgi:hypothetical protein